VRRTQEGYSPFKDDKPKDTENSPFEASSVLVVKANIKEHKKMTNYKLWANEMWQKCQKKVTKTAERLGGSYPYTTENGKYKQARHISWWTNSFWCGMLWLMYKETKDERFKAWANEYENQLNTLFESQERLDHDVGFMWLHSSVNNYEITGNETSKNYALLAASTLAARYNIRAGYIRAWNGRDGEDAEMRKGWAIIDCMMNIPLLYWATKQTNDNRFKYIGIAFADKVLENFIRPDGSVCHIVEFNPENGDFVKSYGGQGYCEGSSWSRGQAWAINGFAQSYNEIGDIRYLDAAKRVANYFMNACSENPVPRCDFRQPVDAVAYDSSAAAIAASGIIDIALACEGAEREMYLASAVRLLKALDERCCPWDDPEDEAIVNFGMEHFNNGQKALIYGDYYFLEAILKLKNLNF